MKTASFLVSIATVQGQMPGQQICDPLSPTYNQAMCDQLTGGGGQLPDIPTAPPQPEARPYEGLRCATNEWNIAKPQASTGSYCPQYECNSCCNDDKFIQALGPKGTADTTLQYGPYQFHGCSSSGKKEIGGSMGSKCHEFIKTAHCVQSCDPNSYVFFPGGENVRGASGIPTCDNFCQDFFNACADEHMCYNKDAITEILLNYEEGKTDYKIFQCEGDYTCEKLRDTPFAGSGMLYELNPALKEKVRELIDEKFGGMRRKSHQIFCERFSTKLFSPVDNANDRCYDPRNPADLEQAVRDTESDFNDKNIKTEFPVTEVCSTGLSGGAIAGIVIGCLAGVALIGVAIYFLACNTKDDDKGKYEVTQQNETDQRIEMKTEGDIVKGTSIKSNHDYDPNESKVESN